MRYSTPGLPQPRQHRRQVPEELAAADVDHGGEPLRARTCGPAGQHPDQVREHLGGQVVDDVPVEVLEHRGRSRPARAGHPGDDQDLRLAQVGRLGGRLEGGDPGGHRDRRRLVAHASSMPADSGTGSDATPGEASAATTAAAVRSPMPCTDAISSTDAARSRLTDPKCRSSAA